MDLGWQLINRYQDSTKYNILYESTALEPTGLSEPISIFFRLHAGEWIRLEPTNYFNQTPQFASNLNVYYPPNGFYLGVAIRPIIFMSYGNRGTEEEPQITPWYLGMEDAVLDSVIMFCRMHLGFKEQEDDYVLSIIDTSKEDVKAIFGDLPSWAVPTGYTQNDFIQGYFTPTDLISKDSIQLADIPILNDPRAWQCYWLNNNIVYKTGVIPTSSMAPSFQSDGYGLDVKVKPLVSKQDGPGDTVGYTITGDTITIGYPFVKQIDLLETNVLSYNQLFTRFFIGGRSASSSSNYENDNTVFEIFFYPVLANGQTPVTPEESPTEGSEADGQEL